MSEVARDRDALHRMLWRALFDIGPGRTEGELAGDRIDRVQVEQARHREGAVETPDERGRIVGARLDVEVRRADAARRRVRAAARVALRCAAELLRLLLIREVAPQDPAFDERLPLGRD